jgi:hypothetical protein
LEVRWKNFPSRGRISNEGWIYDEGILEGNFSIRIFITFFLPKEQFTTSIVTCLKRGWKKKDSE